MFFAIDYNYNTDKWEANECEYWLYIVASQGFSADQSRVIYVGF